MIKCNNLQIVGLIIKEYPELTTKLYHINIYYLSRGGGSGYRIYVFEESTRRCAINRKGRGRKEGDIPTHS
jgi:hypothetical protein